MIYHITTEADWLAEANKTTYESASLAIEGFIHCSTTEQVAGVLERYYANIPDLRLLHIDPTLLTTEVRYEPATNNELFPHIYGPIDRKAVVEVAIL